MTQQIGPAMVEAIYTEEKVQANYTRRAASYDGVTGFEVEHHREAVRLAGIQEGQRVLEVACGTGRGTAGLVRAVGPKGRVDALDLTQAMIDQARAKIEKLGMSDRAHFKQGNARELPYPDGSFDALYNSYMFDLIALDGFAPILKEFARVLKPGGKLVLINMSKPDARKTLFESVYERGWIKTPCRPVLMSPFLAQADFTDVQRFYRGNRALFLPLPFGTEIVLARKRTA